MAGSNLTLLSSYFAAQSGLSSSVFHWMRSIAFVLYALRPFFNHFMYFVVRESSSILLKIKCQTFQAFWGLFCMFIISPSPPPTIATFRCGPRLPIQPSSIPSSL